MGSEWRLNEEMRSRQMKKSLLQPATMKGMSEYDKAFTLVELLVVIAIIGILAALLLPVLSGVKNKAKQTTCLNNLKQISLGIRMYCDDSSDASPAANSKNSSPAAKYPAIAYKELMKNYVGLHGSASPEDWIFACPADRFYYRDLRGGGVILTNAPLHEIARADYSSYWFNGLNVPPRPIPRFGIAGLKITSIKDPVKTVLVAEAPAFYPYSWHQPRLDEGPMFNDAKDMVSFVDGHVSYIRIYWQVVPGGMAVENNPPAGYDYKWSGD